MAQDDTEHAAMIAIAQTGDPRRLLEAIAEVACQLEIKGYTTAEIEGAVAELLGEVRAEPSSPKLGPARRRNYLGLPCIEAWAVRASDPTPGLPMPRFYFDMVEDGVTTHDNDGVEMPSAKLARRAATAIVTVIAYDRATK